MRRKPNELMKQYLIGIAKDYNVKQLVKKVNCKFKENYGEQELRKYLVRNKIEYKYECEHHSNPMGTNVPVGTEYVKPDGMVLVKVSKNQWKYKQRLIYENYYNVALKEDEYIVFLNQDRTDYRIENLRKVTRKESAYLSNMDVFSTDAKITELGINLVKLQIKANEITKKEGMKLC